VRAELREDGFAASLVDVAIAVCAASAGTPLWSSEPAHERIVGAMPDLTLRHQRA